MQKLPIFQMAKHEFTYFATIAMKNAMAVQAIENRLNIMSEAINTLIDRDSSIDLEAFKTSFLNELEGLLQKDTGDTLVGDLNLQDRFNLLELQFEALAERVSKIESALGHEKVVEGEKPNIFDLLV